MKWEVKFIDEAIDDLKKLDNSVRIQVLKAIEKVSENPLPQNEGGYGKPLGNKSGNNLSGLNKIKLRKTGIRVVYKIERTERGIFVIIVSAREDNKVYIDAIKRLYKNRDIHF